MIRATKLAVPVVVWSPVYRRGAIARTPEVAARPAAPSRLPSIRWVACRERWGVPPSPSGVKASYPSKWWRLPSWHWHRYQHISSGPWGPSPVGAHTPWAPGRRPT